MLKHQVDTDEMRKNDEDLLIFLILKISFSLVKEKE